MFGIPKYFRIFDLLINQNNKTMKTFRNITLAFGGILCAIILNHFNCQTTEFNFMLVFGIGTMLSASSFGMYLLVNDK